MRLFVATFPNTECDRFVMDVCLAMSRAYTYEVKFMPEDRDANYYVINFGVSKRMAEATERCIKAGPNGMMGLLSDIAKSVYGLYRTELLSEDISLDDWINR